MINYFIILQHYLYYMYIENTRGEKMTGNESKKEAVYPEILFFSC